MNRESVSARYLLSNPSPCFTFSHLLNLPPVGFTYPPQVLLLHSGQENKPQSCCPFLGAFSQSFEILLPGLALHTWAQVNSLNRPFETWDVFHRQDGYHEFPQTGQLRNSRDVLLTGLEAECSSQGAGMARGGPLPGGRPLSLCVRMGEGPGHSLFNEARIPFTKALLSCPDHLPQALVHPP